MALQVFPDDVVGHPDSDHLASISSNNTNTTKVLRADFGDGYTQRAADGLNNIKQEWNVTWAGIPDATAQNIIDFFEARGGWESFQWTDPIDSIDKLYVCEEWSRSPVSGSHQTINAVFREVFDLGV